MIQVLKNIYFTAERAAFFLLKALAGIFLKNDPHKALLWAIDSPLEKIDEILRRADFYIPDSRVRVIQKRTVKNILYLAFFNGPVLLLNNVYTGVPFWDKFLRRRCQPMFDVDYERKISDGWEWHAALNMFYGKEAEPDIVSVKARFVQRVEELRKLQYRKCYVFGTGPSLSRAIERNWSEGYRVVCNTIVRDQELWKFLAPHFIVAGDAIYHFGHNNFARAFRADLRLRLEESDTLFLYPASFHGLVKREFGQFLDQLIPVPVGQHQSVHVDLTREFSLPQLGNVLPLLLLPLGCTLAKAVFLCGFDGRGPDDKLFWKNSNKHTYSEYMPDLEKAHPAFFGHFIDKKDPQKYVKSVHGDVLDARLQEAEKDGWRFVMMHKTWTSTLQKRYEEKAWEAA
ncbi:MAG: hypothetical protein HQL16_03110 [Candidatus Omnitrophica bacterium]|nr:hypothetical protein [Candidatus Omnitrophota bacterium]